MSESYVKYRIKFRNKGTQRAFILKAQKILGLTGVKLAKKLNISQRTLTDWTREKITISQVSAQTISKLINVPIPKNHTVIDWRTHFQKAGKIGGKNKFLKYGSVGGNEKYRKEKWEEWWEEIGQYKKPAKGFLTLAKIKIPRKSKLLAEFIGILLGDGNISAYHVGIALSSEEKNYIKYVSSVIQKLFGVSPKIFKHKSANAVSIIVNRKLLVDFCQKFGFEMGNKVMHQVDMPEWIKTNKVFSRECIRGLIDTNGCFFTHSYIVRGKKYSYLKIAFTSASRPLLSSFAKTLINSGFNVRISKNQKDVRIDDTRFVNKYIKEIGSHNEKHLQKIRKWKVALNGKAAVC
ncbi:helix-turn-helix domain-containing protein [Candidatus Nomurabacteria bacterium]|nr:helix-turn-helix domain-containing protein [Candidatus Nomurabacteria bacterium]